MDHKQQFFVLVLLQDLYLLRLENHQTTYLHYVIWIIESDIIYLSVLYFNSNF